MGNLAGVDNERRYYGGTYNDGTFLFKVRYDALYCPWPYGPPTTPVNSKNETTIARNKRT